MKVSLFFAWYDFWVGAFYDQKKRTLYICPLPMVVIKIEPKAQPGEDESMAWLCQCGNWEESGLHCLSCGSEPPWGCDCSFCNDHDGSDEYDNFYDEDYEPEEYEPDYEPIFEEEEGQGFPPDEIPF